MGYTTDFTGRFVLNKPLSIAHANYLKAFSDSRRMMRNASLTRALADPIRAKAGLPVGPEGGYFVGAASEDCGQARTDDILDYNSPPAGQPGLWCQWVPSEDGEGIEWNGMEKFYSYTEWLQYLCDHFLTRWHYQLNGTVEWSGESRGDLGVIEVVNNVVTEKKAKISYEAP